MKKMKVLTVGILFMSLIGCSSKDEVTPLIEEEKYEEAYAIIEKEPEKYKDKKDKVAFQLAEIAVSQKQYDKALEYLNENEFEGAKELKEETKKKKVDADFIKDMAKALDERYKEYDKRKSEFSKEANSSYIQKELDIIKKYADVDFYDDELEGWVKEYVEATERQFKSFEQWDTNLFKNSLDSMAANGYRLVAIQKINAKYPIPVSYEGSKETLDGYNKVVSSGEGDANQKLYETCVLKKVDTFDNTGGPIFELSGKNTSHVYLEPEAGYDNFGIFYGAHLLDRNGDFVDQLNDEGLPFLRPGQAFTVKAWVEKPIGDLKDYWVEF
ncbi:hypothetical protein [uncultured Dubosiella sp.]|uniref:hypothetical protein n=1 Tax=uncultured Dubosiella sp. TaxID=1937011 RepID=UPI00272FDB6A|nr:hypothetical protein [uncultured Dubosiella sp.]